MTDTDSTPRYKVGKVIQRYSLDEMAGELENRWIGAEREEHSLRELATYFNRELLRTVLAESDQQYRSGEVDTIYHSLTGDDVSRGEQTRIRKQLERAGIDIEQLQQDFVTHQAIHTFLTKGRAVEKETENEDPIKTASKTINRLRNRLIAVSETTLSRLSNADTITLGSFDILVDINVHCTDCGTHKPLSELLTDRGCECEP